MNEIRTETINKKTPFARWNINRKSAMAFDEDPKFRIGGKNVSIKDTQNAAAIDTNIYEVIEKYRGDLKMSAEQLNQFHIEIDQSLTEIKNLPDAMKAIQKGEEAWNNLDANTKKIFGNSINKFLKEGNDYFKGKIKEYEHNVKLKLEAQKLISENNKNDNENKNVKEN